MAIEIKKRINMANSIVNFINQNVMLSIFFAVVVLAYISFELFLWLSGSSAAKKLSVTQLTMLFNHNNALIIDIRPADAYNSGHIINAVNILAVDCNHQHKLIKSNLSRSIVIVDNSGKEAALCAMNLHKAGIKEVLYLHGGVAAWRSENMPLVTEKSKEKHSKANNINIVIYTKEHCPYCLSAKNLLRSKGCFYKEIKISGADTKEFIEMTQLSGGLKTMPQIFINNQHIGGFDALKSFNDKGELDKILKNI